MIDTALGWAAAGFPVFPIWPIRDGRCGCGADCGRSAGKHPLGALVPQGFLNASTDAATIRAWWTQYPDANLAVPTGPESGLLVLDTDGPAGLEALKALSPPATTWLAQTSRGYHLYFEHPETGTPIKSRPVRPGLDCKAAGGYVLVPPSQHVSGRTYTWLTPPDRMDLAPLPENILQLLTAGPGRSNGAPGESDPGVSDAPTDWGALLQGAPEGERRTVALRIGGHFLALGLRRDEVMGILRAYCALCTPPFPTAEADALVRDLAARDAAKAAARAVERPAVALEDFIAYLEQHRYVYLPTRSLWPGESVNACVPPVALPGGERRVAPTTYLDRFQAAQQMTWVPGADAIIRDKLLLEGGWVERPGATVVNLYVPPPALPGDPTQAQRWRDLVRTLYPTDADHIERWLAHRVQRPGEKLNHALVLLGEEGIGKDTLLVPVIWAVGVWNVKEVNPAQLMGRFNGFIQSVLLRVSEARDQGEVNRYALADHLKTLIAAPPDVLRCDEKYIRAFPVPNTTAVCFTSNHALDALYIAPTSRRYYVAASEVTRDAFAVDYWRDLYAWYRAGGIGHVAAYLRTLDLSGLDPAAAPPLTAAFQTMVAGGESPDLPEMQTLLESIASPPALTLAMLRKAVDVWTPDRDDLSYSFRLWLRDHRNGNQVRHRLIEAGYRPVGNPEEKRRRWLIGKRQTAIYALESLTPNERVAAAKTLIERLRMERPERRS